MIQHCLKTAFRNILKFKTQSAISIIGLAVGITCFSLCAYMIRMQSTHNQRIPGYERTYFLCSAGNNKQEVNEQEICYNRFAIAQLKKDFPEIELVCSYTNAGGFSRKLCEVDGENNRKDYHQIEMLLPDNNFDQFYGLKLIYGDWNDIHKQTDAIILTRSAAMKMFGQENATGKTFNEINDFENKQKTYTIRGIIEDFPVNTDFGDWNIGGFEYNSTHKYLVDTDRSSYYGDMHTVRVRLKKGVDVTMFNTKLRTHTLKYPEEKNKIKEDIVQLKPEKEYLSFSSKGKSNIMPFLFLTIGILVLITALFNYLSFMFGRLFTRLKECGIRKVNGAGKKEIYLLFLTEVIISFVITIVFSFILTELLLPVLKDTGYLFSDISKGYLIWQQVQYGAGGILIMAFLCWIVTQKTGKITLLQCIYGGATAQKKETARLALLGVQLFICLLFTGATYFLFMQASCIEKNMLKGLSAEEKENIYSFSLNGDKLEAARNDFMNAVKNNPNVLAYHRNGMDLFSGWYLRNFSWEGISEETKQKPLIYMHADANYLSIIKASMIKGRFYTPEEQNTAVVNETCARLMGGNPIGKNISIRYWGDEFRTYQIVGIIEDIPVMNNHFSKTQPCAYFPYPDNYINLDFYVQLNPKTKKETLEQLTAVLRRYVSPGTMLYIQNLNATVSNQTQQARSMGTLTLIFSFICITISLLGIYSSVLLSTERRKKEVAIRKINGAGIGSIIHIFTRSYLILLTISAAVAFPVLYIGVNKAFENMAVHVPVNALPFAGIFAGTGIIIALTILSQLMKVIKLNPADVIKNE